MKEPAVVLFDGVCNFCNASVNFVIKRDKDNRFRFTPLQSEAGQQLLTAHEAAAGKKDSIVLIANGHAYTESTAALKIAGGLGFPWNMLTVLLIVPRFIRDGVYRFIARNRYKWFGKKDACMIPDEKMRRKFL